jgi:hypothetical protein
MVVHKEVIQAIRLKKQLAAVQAQLEMGQALREQLLALSGLVEQGVDPRHIEASAQNIQELLKLAEQLEVELKLREGDGYRPAGRIQV